MFPKCFNITCLWTTFRTCYFVKVSFKFVLKPPTSWVIHKGRLHEGEGGLANADACVNFACKKPNFADVGGGGVKNGKILRTSFMDGPFVC